MWSENMDTSRQRRHRQSRRINRPEIGLNPDCVRSVATWLVIDLAPPLISATCNYCKKTGHFVVVCYKAKNKSGGKSVHAVDERSEEESSSDESGGDDGYAHLVNAVQPTKGTQGEWWEEINIGGVNTQIQLDTGAAKSFMSAKTYNQMTEKPPICPTKRKYQSYTQHPIPLLSTAVFPVVWKS